MSFVLGFPIELRRGGGVAIGEYAGGGEYSGRMVVADMVMSIDWLL